MMRLTAALIEEAKKLTGRKSRDISREMHNAARHTLRHHTDPVGYLNRRIADTQALLEYEYESKEEEFRYKTGLLGYQMMLEIVQHHLAESQEAAHD